VLVNLGANVPGWAASYKVTAYPIGARVAATSTGTTLTVDSGHGFRPGDKFFRNPGTDNDFSGTDTVQSVGETSIVMAQSHAVSIGDKLVNLGSDSGVGSPNFDGSPMKIYSDPDSTTVISQATVATDSLGNYGYYTYADGRHWELIRDASDAVVRHVEGYGGIPGVWNPFDFGAACDGSTDDTKSIRACVLAALPRGSVEFPVHMVNSNFYKITDKITIPSGEQWTIRGRGGWARIEQATDNAPIFELNAVNQNTWSIENLRLVHTNIQTSSQSDGIAIANAMTSGGGAYQFEIRNLRIERSYRGIAVSSLGTGQAPIYWGCLIENVWGIDMRGGLIRFVPPTAIGQPRVILRNLYYVNTVGHTNDEPAVRVRSASTAILDGIEINDFQGDDAIHVSGVGHCSIRSVHDVRHNFVTDSRASILVENMHGRVESSDFTVATMPATEAFCVDFAGTDGYLELAALRAFITDAGAAGKTLYFVKEQNMAGLRIHATGLTAGTSTSGSVAGHKTTSGLANRPDNVWHWLGWPGHGQHSFSLFQDNVAGTQTAVQLQKPGTPGLAGYVAPRAGRLLGAAIRSSEARTGGTLTIRATKNGTAFGPNPILRLDATDTTFDTYVEAPIDDIADRDFAAGDLLGAQITTSGWTPTTADVSVELLVVM
jgi:hypothetical protein